MDDYLGKFIWVSDSVRMLMTALCVFSSKALLAKDVSKTLTLGHICTISFHYLQYDFFSFDISMST